MRCIEKRIVKEGRKKVKLAPDTTSVVSVGLVRSGREFAKV